MVNQEKNLVLSLIRGCDFLPAIMRVFCNKNDGGVMDLWQVMI